MYKEPQVLGRTLADIVSKAKELGVDFIPMGQEFLAPALAMMSGGKIKDVQPNPQRGPNDGIIIEIGGEQ